MERLRKSRKYEVTHERIRVMIAMIAKAEKRFHRISLRETQRDKYDDARCLHSQAFGTRTCLEQIRDSGTEIPQATIDEFSSLEKYYEEEAARLEVEGIPEEDLHLSPLMLESRFLIEEIWKQIDPFGSNTNLIDSEAAIALRTPRMYLRSVRELARTAGSSTDWTDQNVDPENRVAAGKGVAKDGNVPTVVLTYSSAKASKNASSSSSTSGDPEKEDGAPAARSGEVLVPNNDPPASPFGRVSGAKIFLLIMNEAFCLL
ncbi:hypothetical protein Bca52824_035631 [Brassica carinata]|uniref:Uncharacterized protein n=1 Tax=Brassica carinata TaxID=52824 RepID=A0A8X7V1W3_BRACI|nr:hypothetical protein Bca52824_035631 [Brassica carinata]